MSNKIRNIRKERGITLIALIITIIILVILAAVSIRAVYNMGIVGHAINGTQDYAGAAKDENKMLGDTSNHIDNALGKLNNIQGGKDENDDKIKEQDKKTSLQPGERAIEKSNYTSGEGANAKTAVIPAGFTVSGNRHETSIDEGLVIYRIPENVTNITWEEGEDNHTPETLRTTYDQFVWIPIPKENINDMFMCQGKTSDTICDIKLDTNGNPYCAKHNNNTNMAGRLYGNNKTGEKFTPGQNNQTYNANSGLREPAIVKSYDGDQSNLNTINGLMTTTDTGESYTTSDFKATLQNEYNAIVKSVYENEGFWVGRYETSGLNGTVKVVAGTTTGIDDQTWYTMYGKQKQYAKSLGMLGGMIQGAAYDQVMKFVDGDTHFDVKSTTQVAHNLGIPYNTGSKSEDKGFNVYDLAGNVLEWTTEAYNAYFRVYRGGSCYDSYSASCRYGSQFPNNTIYLIGSRFALYVK